MKKLILLCSLLILMMSHFTIAGPKIRAGKKTESQKMKAKIDRIEKRVNQLSKNIEDYKKNEEMLDELEMKHLETVEDLKLNK